MGRPHEWTPMWDTNAGEGAGSGPRLSFRDSMAAEAVGTCSSATHARAEGFWIHHRARRSLLPGDQYKVCS